MLTDSAQPCFKCKQHAHSAEVPSVLADALSPRWHKLSSTFLGVFPLAKSSKACGHL